MADMTAGEWLKATGNRIQRRSPSHRAYKSPDLSNYMRTVKSRRETQKEFVERMRNAKSAECIFVPHSTPGRPANISFCDKTISAARYMALLTFGAQKQQGAVVRHLCGSGHLSCVNPAHLEWGSPADNARDAAKHRGCETPQDKIHAANGCK